MKIKNHIFLLTIASFSIVLACQNNESIPAKQNSESTKETVEELFSFNDGETNYTLTKVQPNEPADNEPPYRLKVNPAFKNKVPVSDKPIIDSIFDFDDPGIVLAIDTVIGKEFHFANKFTKDFETLNKEWQNVQQMATAQGLEIVQTKFVLCYPDGGFTFEFNLPEEEAVTEASKICVTVRLRKDGYSLNYPLLFMD